MNEGLIANEIEAASTNYEKCLSGLARCIRKKYNYDGYTTKYTVDKDGVFVVFQRVGNYRPQSYDLTFEEIVKLNVWYPV